MRRTSAGQSLVLASSSPRRRQLLLSIGVDFTIRVPDVDEARLAGEAAEAYVRRLSAAKAAAIEAERSLVLAADTIVVLEGDVLGKPDSDDEARRMLARLAGREHTVLTGVTLRDTDAGTSVSDIAASGVRLRQLSAEEIEWYVATGEPSDKAGAYALQGIGGLFVEAISGQSSNVIGLPLPLVYRLFERIGSDLRELCSTQNSQLPLDTLAAP